jgi:hypothetical protein
MRLASTLSRLFLVLELPVSAVFLPFSGFPAPRGQTVPCFP